MTYTARARNPFRGVHLQRWPEWLGHSGVVHRQVDWTEGRLGLLEGGPHGLAIRHVAAQADRAATPRGELGAHRAHPIGRAGEDHDVRAGVGHVLSRPPALSGGREQAQLPPVDRRCPDLDQRLVRGRHRVLNLAQIDRLVGIAGADERPHQPLPRHAPIGAGP